MDTLTFLENEQTQNGQNGPQGEQSPKTKCPGGVCPKANK